MSKIDTDTFVVVLTAVGTFLATVFGRDGWDYLIKKSESDVGHNCREEIDRLGNIIADQKLQTQQIVTGVDMMLTMLEDEFAHETKYKNVIKKVREYINPS